MDLRGILRHDPAGTPLAHRDPAGTPLAPGTKAKTREAAAGQAAELAELQERLFAEATAGGQRRLLVVLQGMDTSGKGGTIKHAIGAMNPQGVQVASFKKPTEEERRHHFLWRIRRRVPGPGMVGVFDRSHYEDVLVARVHGLVPKAVWAPRYQLINDFEKLLAVENATTILKFFLYISKDEQLARFEERLDTPAKNWKISDADYKEREYWDQYEAAFEDVLSKTSTKHAPWFVIPANHKWFRDLAISAIIVDAMQAMKMRPPEPTVDLAEIRRLYHAAAATQDGRGSHKNKRAEQKVPLPRPAGR
jgi:PPK2 family polyphosphate:nucleotide phosphotransferase